LSSVTDTARVATALSVFSDTDTACVANKVGCVENCPVILILLVWPLLWLCLKLSSDTDTACLVTALAVFKISSDPDTACVATKFGCV